MDMNMDANTFVDHISETLGVGRELSPWEIVSRLPEILNALLPGLGEEFAIHDGIAVHRSAKIEGSAIMKPPVIIGENCFVGAHACLRGGVFLGKGTSIGHACEIKTTVFMEKSAAAHFNFIGDSLIGSRVNFEAGAIVANHFNERADKRIRLRQEGNLVETGVVKFGALVGDGCRIGANAVLSPGTVLARNTIVKRLELVQQDPE
jgi:bifunctional N-acetylglucosamine-1-phosphate-uridyltransferase/glucosamine-1-phosphate-acetyltransferase GlmU-like protein